MGASVSDQPFSFFRSKQVTTILSASGLSDPTNHLLKLFPGNALYYQISAMLLIFIFLPSYEAASSSDA